MEALLPKLLELGPPGLLFAILLWAWINSEKRNDASIERIKQMNDMMLEAAKETVRHIENNTHILTVLKDVQSQRESATENIKDRINDIHGELKSLSDHMRRPRR